MRGRLGSLIHAGAAAGLVIAVVAVAYGSAAPELSVAEFAPAARSGLEAPPTTAGGQVAGASGGRRSSTSTVPATTVPVVPTDVTGASAPTIKVGRGRPCYGQPPRQTEDPMSPSCIPTIFEGDNGGATSRGISSTEIRVGVPMTSGIVSFVPSVDALFEYMNQRFELYGRRLVPVYVQGATASTALTGRARAAEVVAQGVFAAVTGVHEWHIGQVALPAELAREKVVTIVRGASTWWTNRTLYDQFHPYAWSVYPASEDVQAALGSFSCSAWAGRPATHAKDTGLRTTTRRFALVSLGQESAPASSVVADQLADCTGAAPLRLEVQTGVNAAALRTGMENLRAAGATTLICLCEAGSASTAINNARDINFFPEWLLTPTYLGTGNDEHWLQSLRRLDQVAAPVRLGTGPRLLPLQARPWFPAIEPVLQRPGLTLSTVLSMGEFVYSELLVLAAGIQGAGPNLTPESFAAALMGSTFPNPGAGQAPFYQPSAGFGPGDHSFYDDYDVAWWSDAAPALDQPVSTAATGSWCYLDQAARYRAGEFPADSEARLFDSAQPCR